MSILDRPIILEGALTVGYGDGIETAPPPLETPILQSNAGNRYDRSPRMVAGMRLKVGAAGRAVRVLQTKLVENSNVVKVDGSFGPETEKAVRGFQDDNDLQVDGVVGRQTMAALMGSKKASSISPGPMPASSVRMLGYSLGRKGGGARKRLMHSAPVRVDELLVIEEAAYNQAAREKMADKGQALKSGGKIVFPIKTAKDVANAVLLWQSGHHKTAAAKAHIIAQAKRVGAVSKLPDAWEITEARIEAAIDGGILQLCEAFLDGGGGGGEVSLDDWANVDSGDDDFVPAGTGTTGSPDPRVAGAQGMLQTCGIDCGPVDGVFGAKTIGAVKQFQAGRPGLRQHGHLDGATLEALDYESTPVGDVD